MTQRLLGNLRHLGNLWLKKFFPKINLGLGREESYVYLAKIWQTRSWKLWPVAVRRLPLLMMAKARRLPLEART